MICENCGYLWEAEYHIKIIPNVCLNEIKEKNSPFFGQFVAMKDGNFFCKDKKLRQVTNFEHKNSSAYYTTQEEFLEIHTSSISQDFYLTGAL